MPPQQDQQFADMQFPLAGVDLTNEFEQQRQGTTPVGQNVRGYEALTERARGGIRPGLTEYIPAQVSGPNLIQHLNYIVDPTEAALTTNFDPLNNLSYQILATGFNFPIGNIFNLAVPTVLPYPDLTNVTEFPPMGGVINPASGPGSEFGGPQYYVREGGSGIGLNRNVGTKLSPPPPPPGTPPSRRVLYWNLSVSRQLVGVVGDFSATGNTANLWGVNGPGFLTFPLVAPPLTWKITLWQCVALNLASQPATVAVSDAIELANGDAGVQVPLLLPTYNIDTSAGGTFQLPGDSSYAYYIYTLDTESFPGGFYPPDLPGFQTNQALPLYLNLP